MKKRWIVMLWFVACGSPARPPAAAPIESTGGEEAASVAEADAMCCCTFDFAIAEDLPDVAKWVSSASVCRSGTTVRIPGQCIAERWCEGVPPDPPPPPPLEASQCCCDVFDGNGESFSVMEADACAARGDASCVDQGFC